MEAGRLLTRGVLFTDEREAGATTEGATPDREEGTSEGAADWATAEPDPEEYMHYIDWDRFDAKGITGATA